nr:MAG TPA: hypothetical protein [Crassvirales sp.]
MSIIVCNLFILPSTVLVVSRPSTIVPSRLVLDVT